MALQYKSRINLEDDKQKELEGWSVHVLHKHLSGKEKAKGEFHSSATGMIKLIETHFSQRCTEKGQEAMGPSYSKENSD